MGRRRHGWGGHGSGGHGGSERWLITYADLITLLVGYFIMMYSLTRLDLAKFHQAMGGYRQAVSSFGIMAGATGNLEGGQGVLDGSRSPVDGGGSQDAGGLEAGLAQLKAEIQAMRLGDHVGVRMTDEGLVVSLAGPLLFDSGMADLRDEARPVLDAVARVIATSQWYRVRVEGHADSVPIQTTRFPSNWELSSARAATVVRALTAASGASGQRFSVVGYGDSRPVLPNTEVEGRARNRRVEIIILKSAAPP